MIDLSTFPVRHEFAEGNHAMIMELPNNSGGLALIAHLRKMVRAHNQAVDPKERLYVKVAGSLGHNNPAYIHYRRNYAYTRLADAKRLRIYLLTQNYQIGYRERIERVLAVCTIEQPSVLPIAA